MKIYYMIIYHTVKKVIFENNIKTIYKLKKLFPGSVKYIRKYNLIEDIRQYMKII